MLEVAKQQGLELDHTYHSTWLRYHMDQNLEYGRLSVGNKVTEKSDTEQKRRQAGRVTADKFVGG